MNSKKIDKIGAMMYTLNIVKVYKKERKKS